VQNPNKCNVEIEIFLVHFALQAAYRIPIKSSVKLCRWMAQNNPTSDSKNVAYNTITEKVVKPWSESEFLRDDYLARGHLRA
jgi:hypothetical protein